MLPIAHGRPVAPPIPWESHACPLASPTVGARAGGRRVVGDVAPSPEHRAASGSGRGADGRDRSGARASSTWTTSSSSCRRTGRSITTSARSPAPTASPQDVCLPDPKRHRCSPPVSRHEPLRSRAARTTSGPRGSRSTRGRWTASIRALRVIGNACRFNPTRHGLREAHTGAERHARRDGLPHGAGDPELLGLRAAVHAAGPDVRAQPTPGRCPRTCTWCRGGRPRATTSIRCSAARIRSSPDSTRRTTAGTGCPPTASHGRTSGRTSRGCCTTTASAGRTTSARTAASGRRAASRPRRARTPS